MTTSKLVLALKNIAAFFTLCAVMYIGLVVGADKLPEQSATVANNEVKAN